MRLVMTAVFLATLGVGEASACNTVRFNFRFGSETSTVMHVGSGKPCPITLRTSARSTFSSVTVSAPARNGTVRAGGSGVTYQSKPGFAGADSFAFTVTGSGASGSGKSTVQVAVTVQ